MTWLREGQWDPRIRLPVLSRITEQTQNEGIEIAELWADGFTMAEIAEKLGYASGQHVRHRLLKSGMYEWARLERAKSAEQREAERIEDEQRRLAERRRERLRRPPIPETGPAKPKLGYYTWRGGLSEQRREQVEAEQKTADQAWVNRDRHAVCPTCGATGGEPCRGRSGRVRADWHVVRLAVDGAA